ncbi:MAG: DUF86 domain-containing protein [Beijerinckiaceae bacterium]|nr:DUF86 domain-containing protein [Beijerinckiaceae bacterium]
MLSEKAISALFDIRDCILLARGFAEGLTYETFKASKLHFFAMTRALEIISEASRRLPDEMHERHPDLPWREIRDVGNFYRYQYDNVAESYVWATVHDHLPPLLAAVVAEIEALGRTL